MPPDLVFLDTETAATRGAPHLVELAAVRLGASGERDEFSSLVRARVPIQPEAQAVHGLAQPDLEAAPEAIEVLTRFESWLGDALLLAHNASFDAQVLGFEFARLRRRPPKARLFDTLKLSRRAFPRASDHKLATLARELAFESQPLHRALADARSCAELFRACAAALGFAPCAEAADIARHAGRPLELENCGPRRPRMRGAARRALEALEQALERGSEVLLEYRSTPSAEDPEPLRLHVQPRLLYHAHDHGWLEALCRASGLLKTYRIDRIAGLEPIALSP